MRLSEWRRRSPTKEAMAAKVVAVVEPVLGALGAVRDPECWVVWGDDARYSIYAITPAGLATCHVRVNVPQEGPRASGKLVRWNRVQLGELAVETQGGHRIVSAQLEQAVLRGVDDEADEVSRFIVELIAAVDGRTLPPRPAPSKRSKADGAPALAASGRGRSPAGAAREPHR